MPPKRHFTGRSVVDDPSSSSGSESESEDGQVVEKVPKLKAETEYIQEVSSLRKPEPVQESQPAKQEIESAEEGDDNNDIESTGSDESDSESGSESDESSEEEQLLKPVFLSKKQRFQKTSKERTSKTDAKERTLRAIEKNMQTDLELKKQANTTFNYAPEIEDTDDLDPEAERAAWELRQLEREKRDREKLEREQDELEELEERRLRTEEEREDDSRKQEYEKGKKVYKGAFFQDDDILKRDLEDDSVEVYDKRLLPQRYDPTRK